MERAPWWGGFWERLIRSIKRCLKKCIGRANLTFEQLRTMLVEIEAVINARPLTYVCDDQEGVSHLHILFTEEKSPLFRIMKYLKSLALINH